MALAARHTLLIIRCPWVSLALLPASVQQIFARQTLVPVALLVVMVGTAEASAAAARFLRARSKHRRTEAQIRDVGYGTTGARLVWDSDLRAVQRRLLSAVPPRTVTQVASDVSVGQLRAWAAVRFAGPGITGAQQQLLSLVVTTHVRSRHHPEWLERLAARTAQPDFPPGARVTSRCLPRGDSRWFRALAGDPVAHPRSRRAPITEGAWLLAPLLRRHAAAKPGRPAVFRSTKGDGAVVLKETLTTLALQTRQATEFAQQRPALQTRSGVVPSQSNSLTQQAQQQQAQQQAQQQPQQQAQQQARSQRKRTQLQRNKRSEARLRHEAAVEELQKEEFTARVGVSRDVLLMIASAATLVLVCCLVCAATKSGLWAPAHVGHIAWAGGSTTMLRCLAVTLPAVVLVAALMTRAHA